MAKAAALKALELDESLAVAHEALGCVHWLYDWDLRAAESEILRALELNPGDAIAHLWYGTFVCLIKEDLERARAEAKQAQELDPLALLVNSTLGWGYVVVDQYGRAIEQARKTLEIYPDSLHAYSVLGLASLAKGILGDAVAALEKAVAISRDSFSLAILGHAYARSGQAGKAEALLSELLERSEREYVLPTAFATLYTGLGQKDSAFCWLGKAYEERLGMLFWLKAAPVYHPLRDDPRFQDLVRRIGLPP